MRVLLGAVGLFVGILTAGTREASAANGWVNDPLDTGGSSRDRGQTLSLEERIGYQRVIEEVYWRHRIWPEQNRVPKMSLDQVMPLATIRRKVEDYLRQSEALKTFWNRPITPEQLQAEIDRMALQTKRPEMLNELWAALGHDPFVIAECLARPALANRLIRRWYAHDERYHGESKRRVEEELGRYATPGEMLKMSGEYQELEWVKRESEEKREHESTVALSSEPWEAKVRELAVSFAGGKETSSALREEPLDLREEPDRLPLKKLSRLQEEEDRFYVLAVLKKDKGRLKVATVGWRKKGFAEWWNEVRDQLHGEVADQGDGYRLGEIKAPSGSCADDTWTPTPALEARGYHTAVWTGSEMIVWGGSRYLTFFNTGGRYDPATDSWTPMSTLNAPTARYFHTAVWTGSEMIVWGGSVDGRTYFNTGGRYDLATDSWTPMRTVGAPSPRDLHTAIWTGTEMIVWGGKTGYLMYSSTGGRYDPTTDRWTGTSGLNAPSERSGHTAVWTGTEMIIWGGARRNRPPFPDTYFVTGGRYEPATDSWTPTSTLNAPSARSSHTAVWSEREMIVWGGVNATFAFETGGRYDLVTDSWRPTSTLNAPSARRFHTALWTGSEMIVWGGYRVSATFFNTGGRYDPATDSWMPTSTLNAPSARNLHTAVWTEREMIVWGGGGPSYFNTGGRYDPSTDSWTPTNTLNEPSARRFHTALWTGSEMLVWGGSFYDYFNTGGRYDPSTDSWTPTSTLNAPSARDNHSAVWTGIEMIVWGGFAGYPNFFNTGGRYDPATDSWRPTSTLNAPCARNYQTAVWSGSEVIVWGGFAGFPPLTYFNTGGRYDPATNSWRSTSTQNAPSARYLHTAAWTGNEMIVWGGHGDADFNTGGRYAPATDDWTPTSVLNAPSARYLHTGAWTGTQMIVWGGAAGEVALYFNTGGRYDPATDEWTPTNTLNAPSARVGHSAVWTGSEMIVWGGFSFPPDSYFNTGGRYDPPTNSWMSTNTLDVPSSRRAHTAVWTQSEMIIWGGANANSAFETGGRYCANRQ